jgi:hypothetical protein
LISSSHNFQIFLWISSWKRLHRNQFGNSIDWFANITESILLSGEPITSSTIRNWEISILKWIISIPFKRYSNCLCSLSLGCFRLCVSDRECFKFPWWLILCRNGLIALQDRVARNAWSASLWVCLIASIFLVGYLSPIWRREESLPSTGSSMNNKILKKLFQWDVLE